MQWYLAKLVYKIVCSHPNDILQTDEQIRLIYADDLLHAFLKPGCWVKQKV